MAIASGTCGTCSWTIADDGAMTIGAGTLHAPWLPGVMNCGWPWGGHVKDITSCTIRTGVIVGKQEALMGGYVDDYVTSNMFYGCSNMTSLIFEGTFDTSNVTDMSGMFCDCSSLTSLSLTSFNTNRVKDMGIMFLGCALLTSVTFGPLFNTLSLEDTSGTGFINSSFPSAVSQTGRIVVTSDADFRALTPAQHAGTWTRSAANVMFKVSAERTDNGSADDDGEDATITVTWLTGASTSERTLSVYMKSAADASYPTEPTEVMTLEGSSGTNSVTIEGIGDDAFDFKVEFYDGTDTYIAFPSVSSNVRLVTIDGNGCVEVAGNAANSSWVTQRDNAAIRRIRKITDSLMYPVLDALTQLGDWALDTYGEDLYLSYITNENYESDTNTQSGYCKFGSDGSIAPMGRYMSGSKPLFVMATMSLDNKTIAKSSTLSIDFSVAKDGYTPFAIRGFDIDNATSSGANVANCVVLAAKLKDSGKAEFQIRNNATSAAKLKLWIFITYIATEAL
jgi:surface protein